MINGKQTQVCPRTVLSQTVTPHLKKAEYIKNNYQLLIIKLLIVCLFIATLYIGFNRIYNRWYLEWIMDSDELMTNGQFLRHIKSNLRPTLIVLIPLVGILTNKKIGWILITSYFYMLLSDLSFSSIPLNSTDTRDYVFTGALISLFTTLIIVMNMKKIWSRVYGFKKTEMITKNIVASIIGMGITIMLAYIKQ